MSCASRTICTDVHVQNKDCAGGRWQHTDRPVPLLSGPISVWQVNGEHKTYLKATFTTWLIPLHCVISRCHISPPHVCLNALPSTLWLVSLGWLPQIHSSGAPHPFTSSLRGKALCSTFSIGGSFYIKIILDTDLNSPGLFTGWPTVSFSPAMHWLLKNTLQLKFCNLKKACSFRNNENNNNLLPP